MIGPRLGHAPPAARKVFRTSAAHPSLIIQVESSLNNAQAMSFGMNITSSRSTSKKSPGV